MKKLAGLIVVMLGLSGCGTHSLTQSNLPPGQAVGWNHHVYKVVKMISPNEAGKKLGEVTYHGKISGMFTLFELKGINTTKSIVVESPTGQYFQANVGGV